MHWRAGRATGERAMDMSFREIATRLVAARRGAEPLAAFPGKLPVDLDSAYRIQDIAIGLWPHRIGGWKVGRIPPELENRLGVDRLAGPIFENRIRSAASGDSVRMPAFRGGFAAIEAEYVAIIARDAPEGKTSWTTGEAAAMIGDLRIGLEMASSPIAAINELGPTAVVSDFGNNAGLIIGPAIANWRTRELESMRVKAHIDRTLVGQGGAFNLTGGFVRSVQFLLELTAARGIPLKARDAIATGQTSGIHDIRTAQTGALDFGDDGVLGCIVEDATPAR